jgi:hypothetical protein
VHVPRQARGSTSVGASVAKPPEARPAVGGIEAVLELQRAAGNRAVTAELARRAPDLVIQRSIQIGDQTFSATSGAREFRRDLMLHLRRNDFIETGTKALWQAVEVQLASKDLSYYPTWDAALQSMQMAGFLDKGLPPSKVRIGPRGLGKRPGWRTDTRRAIKSARKDTKGLAARHVISSSTLGLAIESLPDDLGVLNAWLRDHGHPGNAPTPLGAKQAIWNLVHNHAGNLWMGESEPNTAIGFIRDRLAALKRPRGTPPAGDMDVGLLLEDIEKTKIEEVNPQHRMRDETWNLLLDQLYADVQEHFLGPADGDDAEPMPDAPASFPAEGADVDSMEVDAEPVSTAPGAGAAPAQAAVFADRDAVCDLIDMYIRNADIDLPALVGDEYTTIVQIFEALRSPGTVLPALHRFLTLDLSESIAANGQ